MTAIVAVETVVSIEQRDQCAVFFRIQTILLIASDMRRSGYRAAADRLERAARCAERGELGEVAA